VAERALRRNPTEGREGRIVWEALPKCKASQRQALRVTSPAGWVAHIHSTTALTKTSDRTTPPAPAPPLQQQRQLLFFTCSSSRRAHTVWLCCYRYEMQEAAKARHGVAPGRALPAQEALVPRQRGAAAQEYVALLITRSLLFCSSGSLDPVSDPCCCSVLCRERDLHPVRRRQVMPMRGRARAVVHPRGVPRPAAADPDADAAGA